MSWPPWRTLLILSEGWPERVVAAAAEKARALTVGSQGILQGNVLKLQGEVKKGL